MGSLRSSNHSWLHDWNRPIEMYVYLQNMENNWKNARHTLTRIECHSENSKGVYCLQYDDHKIISGLRDNTIKVFHALPCVWKSVNDFYMDNNWALHCLGAVHTQTISLCVCSLCALAVRVGPISGRQGGCLPCNRTWSDSIPSSLHYPIPS